MFLPHQVLKFIFVESRLCVLTNGFILIPKVWGKQTSISYLCLIVFIDHSYCKGMLAILAHIHSVPWWREVELKLIM